MKKDEIEEEDLMAWGGVKKNGSRGIFGINDKVRVHHKQWLGRKANIKTLKRYCSDIWNLIIKQKDPKCVICNETKYLNAHHIISKSCLQFKYEIWNGISLCPKCHQFGIKSAHKSPWFLYLWLQNNRPEQYSWFLKNRIKVDYGEQKKLSKEDYLNLMKVLIEKYQEMNPIIYRRSRHFKFDEKEEERICYEYNILGASKIQLSDKYKCGGGYIANILKRYKIPMRNEGRRKSEKEKTAELELNSTNVLKLDVNNNILEEYGSIKQAVENNPGFSAIMIKTCVKGKMANTINIYRGFKWIFKKNFEKNGVT